MKNTKKTLLFVTMALLGQASQNIQAAFSYNPLGNLTTVIWSKAKQTAASGVMNAGGYVASGARTVYNRLPNVQGTGNQEIERERAAIKGYQPTNMMAQRLKNTFDSIKGDEDKVRNRKEFITRTLQKMDHGLDAKDPKLRVTAPVNTMNKILYHERTLKDRCTHLATLEIILNKLPVTIDKETQVRTEASKEKYAEALLWLGEQVDTNKGIMELIKDKFGKKPTMEQLDRDFLIALKKAEDVISVIGNRIHKDQLDNQQVINTVFFFADERQRAVLAHLVKAEKEDVIHAKQLEKLHHNILSQFNGKQLIADVIKNSLTILDAERRQQTLAGKVKNTTRKQAEKIAYNTALYGLAAKGALSMQTRITPKKIAESFTSAAGVSRIATTTVATATLYGAYRLYKWYTSQKTPIDKVQLTQFQANALDVERTKEENARLRGKINTLAAVAHQKPTMSKLQLAVQEALKGESSVTNPAPKYKNQNNDTATSRTTATADDVQTSPANATTVAYEDGQENFGS